MMSGSGVFSTTPSRRGEPERRIGVTTVFSLPPGAFGAAGVLFDGLDRHVAIRAVLTGAVPGAVYGDDPVEPRVALLRAGHRLYLAAARGSGTPSGRQRRRFLDEALKREPWTLARGFVIYPAPGAWAAGVDERLAGRRPRLASRCYYRFRALRNDWRTLLPTGLRMRPVDAGLLADGRLVNVDRLAAEVRSEAPTVDHFVRCCFGFCVVTGSEIVAWCLSEYNVADRIELGIETVEGYRRRGLATAVASAVVEHALERGVTEIGWHCYAGNAGSVATARRVGFEKAGEYTVYWVPAAGAD
jgi:GNAT superfamily N-acetyltransferase